MKKNLVIILSGGSGQRLNKQKAKQFLCLCNKPIIAHTLNVFENHQEIDEIFIVTNPSYMEETKKIVLENKFTKVKKILKGGSTRQCSAKIGLDNVDKNIIQNIIMHDAVRPFVSNNLISNILENLKQYKAVNIAIDTTDTLIEVDEHNFIKSIPNRKTIKRVQTPQGFNSDILIKAHNIATEKKWTEATDDCSLILKFNLAKVKVIQGEEQNIKITYPQDLTIGNEIIKQKN